MYATRVHELLEQGRELVVTIGIYFFMHTLVIDKLPKDRNVPS